MSKLDNMCDVRTLCVIGRTIKSGLKDWQDSILRHANTIEHIRSSEIRNFGKKTAARFIMLRNMFGYDKLMNHIYTVYRKEIMGE